MSASSNHCARLGSKETWLGYQASCPYCASHTIAFILVPLTGTYAIDVVVGPGWAASVLEWFLSSILVTVIAAFLRVAFWMVDEQQALLRREKQLVERSGARPLDGASAPPNHASV